MSSKPPAAAPPPCAWWPIAEACRQLGGISRATFYRRVEALDLPLGKIGRRTVIRPEVAARMVEEPDADGRVEPHPQGGGPTEEPRP